MISVCLEVAPDPDVVDQDADTALALPATRMRTGPSFTEAIGASVSAVPGFEIIEDSRRR